MPAESVVYYTQRSEAISRLEENPRVTRQMVDELIMAVTGQKSVAAGWRSLVTPKDRIGIKVSAAGGRYFSTHLGVVEAIVAGLEQAGVPAAQIIVWDRDAERLKEARFINRRGGYTVRSIPTSESYDRATELVAPVLGKLIWGDLLFQEKQRKASLFRASEAEMLSSTSHLATVLSREVTKVINVPVLADESACGVAGALYNMTIPNIDNWRRFLQSDISGADSIPALYDDEHIGAKVVLHILDGLVAQYAGGPSGNPNYAFAHGTLYASKDPVAIDTVAVRQLEAWRHEARLPPIGARAEWLHTASELGLGNAEHIDLKKITTEP
ncbi:MAG: hypothetical protein JWL59_2575 [Chthoniobacteraceae bacterium]|nr:hypothetical protein [Chthoniobacteraceae bacterium]